MGLNQKSHYFDKAHDYASPIKVGRLRPESSKHSTSSHSSGGSKSPFNRWNIDIQKVSNKKIEKDLAPSYKVLLNVLNEREEYAEVIKALQSS